MSRSKIILVGGTILAVFVLLFTVSPQIFLRPPTTPGTISGEPNLSNNTQGDENPSGLGNAFVPFEGLGGSVAGGPPGGEKAGLPKSPVTLQNIADMIGSALSTPLPVASSPSLLSLPTVQDNELKISPSGASTIKDYMAYFNAHSADVAFAATQFDKVLKDKSGVLLFPMDLVKDALASGDLRSIHESLAVYKEYYEAKIAFEKSLAVTGEAIDLNKKIIAFDKLTLSMIQKTFDVEAGDEDVGSLKTYYDSFVATANAERREILQKTGVLALERVDWLDRIASLLGLSVENASAIDSFGFGGQIVGLPIPCPCSFGYLIAIGPPKPPLPVGTLFVPVTFLATPLFYNYKSMITSVWWLGLYFPTTIPCAAPPVCQPIGLGSEIYMTGTSLL